MIHLLKKLFKKEKKDKVEEDPPGRTFKRILTGDYFSLQDLDAPSDQIHAAKQDKIDKINELALSPKFIRYSFQRRYGDDEPLIEAAHVVFQKEVLDEKWHMVHVTEVSFIVRKEEFEEFEKMANVSLKTDFRDLTEYSQEHAYKGKERRRERRPSVFS